VYTSYYTYMYLDAGISIGIGIGIGMGIYPPRMSRRLPTRVVHVRRRENRSAGMLQAGSHELPPPVLSLVSAALTALRAVTQTWP
jgi:hypothetical protein